MKAYLDLTDNTVVIAYNKDYKDCKDGPIIGVTKYFTRNMVDIQVSPTKILWFYSHEILENLGKL